MSNKKRITYTKDDKEFVIESHSVKKRKLKTWFVCFLYSFFIILFLLASLFIIKTIFKTSNANKIVYVENGTANYKVYLKENDYYEEKYLDNSSRIIANLINTISIDFNYNIKSTEKLNYNYSYEIIGELLIYDKQDSNKPLHKKKYDLLSDNLNANNQTNININKDIVIDYEEYNKYFNSFKSTYGINSVGELVVKMIITSDTYKDKEEKNTTVNELSVSIPLSEQTIDITLKANDFSKTNEISVKPNSKVTIFEILSLCLTVSILLVLIIKFIIYLDKLYSLKNNPYERALKKILKEYDSIIVNATSSFIERKDKVIRVADFKELLDAQKLHNVPILFYEVEKGNKAYFVIKDNETVYRYTLTKAYQMKNKK